MKINNSKKDAVSGKWENPGADLYNKLNKEKNREGLLKEAYLITPLKEADTPFSRSECKYPHHVVVDDELVLHRGGVKAAYARAKQMDVFDEVKDHLEKHYEELEMKMNADEIMKENFSILDEKIMSLNDSYERSTDEVFEESLKEIFQKMKKFVGRVMKQFNIFNLPKTTQSCKYLDQLILQPKKTEPGLPVFGTDIRLDTDDVKTESYDSAGEEDDLLDNFLVEAFDSKDKLAMAEKFAKERNLPLLIIEPGTKLDSMMPLGALMAIGNLTRAQLSEWQKTGDISTPIGEMTRDTIIVLLYIKKNIKIVQTPRAMELVLAHEYGHACTIHKFTKADWSEYLYKVGVITTLPTMGSVMEHADLKFLLCMQACYFNLKLEKAANDHADIDFSEFFKALTGFSLPPNWEKSKIHNIVNLAIPDRVMSISMKRSTGGNISKSELIALLVFGNVMADRCLEGKMLEAFKEESKKGLDGATQNIGGVEQ